MEEKPRDTGSTYTSGSKGQERQPMLTPNPSNILHHKTELLGTLFSIQPLNLALARRQGQTGDGIAFGINRAGSRPLEVRSRDP
jgi:hypothetical protein